eukprot:4731699-Alexandrium_andersonii.AAC.1
MVAIIAGAVPEQQTKDWIKGAEAKTVNIIGPATVSGIKPGGLRMGDPGGVLDNIVLLHWYEWSLGMRLTQLNAAVYGMAYAPRQ